VASVLSRIPRVVFDFINASILRCLLRLPKRLRQTRPPLAWLRFIHVRFTLRFIRLATQSWALRKRAGSARRSCDMGLAAVAAERRGL